jgi:hypothetical protein
MSVTVVTLLHTDYIYAGFCVTVRRASHRDRHFIVALIVIEKKA